MTQIQSESPWQSAPVLPFALVEKGDVAYTRALTAIPAPDIVLEGSAKTFLCALPTPDGLARAKAFTRRL